MKAKKLDQFTPAELAAYFYSPDPEHDHPEEIPDTSEPYKENN